MKNNIENLFLSQMRYIFLFGVLLLSVQQIVAQIPYRCDFSDSSENDNWVLNLGTTSSYTNLWYIGNPSEADADGASDGNFLYMSSDGGVTNSYDGIANIVMSYRTINFPESGTYDLAFDWRALGGSELIYDDDFNFIFSQTAELFVLLYPESMNGIIPLTSQLSYTGDEPSSFTFKQYFNNNSYESSLYGYEDWTHATAKLTIPSNGSGDYRLVFVWANTKSTAYPPGGSIDNIEITSATYVMPEDLVVNSIDNTATFSWSGSADSYELKFAECGTYNWTTVTGITDTYYVANNVVDGVYDVKIRSIYNTNDPTVSDTSVWALFEEVCIYEKGCIDYTNLDNAYCTTGSYDDPYNSQGRVNYGYESSYSRHTLHYDQTEYDAQTNYGLKTVPDDAVASIRLGNWESGAEAESITYDYVVDTDVESIMLINYAVVIEAPGHGPDQDPKFKIEILDEDGNLVDATCGTVDFSATYVVAGENGWSQNYNNWGNFVMWKDWTTVGFNLEDYDGRTLKIRLTTYDCELSAHFGYAYFTLSCSDGKLEGINYGDTPTDSLVAPDGFYYEWYDVSDSTTILSTDRIFFVDSDDFTIYAVNCISQANESCYFTLTAITDKSHVVADASYELVAGNCEYTAHLTNESYLYADGSEDKSEPIESIYWIYPDGTVDTDTEIYYTMPNDGSEVSIQLVATIGANLLVDTAIITLQSPIIFQDTIYADSVTITLADLPYTYRGNVYDENTTVGEYTSNVTLTDSEGCKYVVVYTLIVESDEVIDDEEESTSVSNLSTKDLAIYPNPVSSGATLYISADFTAAERDGMVIEVINSVGQCVIKEFATTDPIEINGLSQAGVYIVRITTGIGETYISKVVVE